MFTPPTCAIVIVNAKEQKWHLNHDNLITSKKMKQNKKRDELQ